MRRVDVGVGRNPVGVQRQGVVKGLLHGNAIDIGIVADGHGVNGVAVDVNVPREIGARQTRPDKDRNDGENPEAKGEAVAYLSGRAL